MFDMTWHFQPLVTLARLRKIHHLAKLDKYGIGVRVFALVSSCTEKGYVLRKDQFHVHTTFVFTKYYCTHKNESNSCSNKHAGTCSFCRQDFKTQTIDGCYLFIVIWHPFLHIYLFKTILAHTEQCQSSEKKSCSSPVLWSCQELQLTILDSVLKNLWT